MPQTVTKRAPARPTPPRTRPGVVDATTHLSDDVLGSVEAGQRAAIEAVRTFVDTVDRALPSLGDGPSKRQEIVDSAMEMADRLVHTQYEFIRKVIDGAGATVKSLDRRGSGDPE
ncbi:MAG: hypothetical protein ABSH51_23815 [Solirubrobacteraceae bacterium]|jgi:hypothetical protein